MNHVKNSFLSGFIYGLKIKFYTGHYEKLDSFLSYLDILGVNVKIENNSFSVDSNNGFEVKSGTRTHVAIERIFKYNLPKPYSNCDIDNIENDKVSDGKLKSSLFMRIRNSSYQYEQQFCISM